jgi:hypothetical protein
MRFQEFLELLKLRLKKASNYTVGPIISIKIGCNPSIHISNASVNLNHNRFIIFPIKIYGETLRHLNIVLLDNKTKIVERFEPFNGYISFKQINDLLEPFLYKLMEKKKIYFLKYQNTLNTETVLTDKNCGYYCIEYVYRTIIVF